MSLKEFRSALKEDTKFKRYVSIRDTVIKSVNYEALMDDVERIHKLRVPSLKSNIQPRELLSLSMNEASHRARLTEILVRVRRVRADLSTVGDEVWNHAASEYAEHLSDIRTKADRESAVTSCFRIGNEFVARMDALIEVCESAIHDIDQSSYHLNRVASLFELVLRRENLANVDV